jgi:DNA-binding NarL/FixJ family response regulator
MQEGMLMGPVTQADAAQGRARVAIVDDHPLVREGLRLLISGTSDLEVCGEADSVPAALTLVRDERPDIMLVDISLRDGYGIDLVRQVAQEEGAPYMLVLSMFDESQFAERALQAGAMGFLNKQSSRETVIDGIRTVLKGQVCLSPAMTQRLLSRVTGARQQSSGETLNQLTDRELQVFQMIGQALSTREIAEQLHLSVHTVETHREKIKRKLGARNSVELTRQAVQWVLDNG